MKLVFYAAMLLIFFGVAIATSAQLAETGYGCTNFVSGYANVRSAPSLTAYPVAAVGNGVCMDVFEIEDDTVEGDEVFQWAKVELASGDTGWISTSIFTVMQFPRTIVITPTDLLPTLTPTAHATATPVAVTEDAGAVYPTPTLEAITGDCSGWETHSVLVLDDTRIILQSCNDWR